MEIREATQGDFETLVSFQLAMATETEEISLDESTVTKGVEAVLKDGNKGKYYVADSGEQVVASLLTTYEWSDWRNGTILWIQSVYVLPEYRRKGIYSKLYAYVKKTVVENDSLNGIRLYADKNNTVAHKTYRKLGMVDDHYVTFEWLK